MVLQQKKVRTDGFTSAFKFMPIANFNLSLNMPIHKLPPPKLYNVKSVVISWIFVVQSPSYILPYISICWLLRISLNVKMLGAWNIAKYGQFMGFLHFVVLLICWLPVFLCVTWNVKWHLKETTRGFGGILRILVQCEDLMHLKTLKSAHLLYSVVCWSCVLQTYPGYCKTGAP